MTGEPGDTDVTRYLDRLAVRLQGPPEHVRRLLDEADAHLADAVARSLAGGADPVAARRDALARFGRVEVVAHEMNRATRSRYRRPVAREVATTLAAVAAAGLLALVVVVVGRRAPERTGLVPPTTGPALAVVAFTLGALTTAVLAARDAVVFSTWGAGLLWTAAATCTAAAAVSAARLGWVRTGGRALSAR